MYTAVTFYAVLMTNVTEFYVMSVAIGCVQGAIQAMSRSYYSRLIPADRASEFFGFYNMMGKFAAVLGPFLMAATAVITGNSRTRDPVGRGAVRRRRDHARVVAARRRVERRGSGLSRRRRCAQRSAA